MNVYDFDKTIYAGDSSVDFYLFCLRTYPHIATNIFKQMQGVFSYAVGRIDTTAMKELFFCFLSTLEDPYATLELFWETHQKKIKKWYLGNKTESDIIISASPYFLLVPVCDRLGIRKPIATWMDIYSGKINGKNCKGQEKVRRFLEEHPQENIDTFYSDSLTDLPLANIARKAVLVKGDMLSVWPTTKARQK